MLASETTFTVGRQLLTSHQSLVRMLGKHTIIDPEIPLAVYKDGRHERSLKVKPKNLNYPLVVGCGITHNLLSQKKISSKTGAKLKTQKIVLVNKCF